MLPKWVMERRRGRMRMRKSVRKGDEEDFEREVRAEWRAMEDWLSFFSLV